jgi:hypothetical protein
MKLQIHFGLRSPGNDTLLEPVAYRWVLNGTELDPSSRLLALCGTWPHVGYGTHPSSHRKIMWSVLAIVDT